MIDAHIHLDDSRFDKNRQKLIKTAQLAGIKQFITPAVAFSGFTKLYELTKKFQRILPCYGLHPYFVNSHEEADIDRLDLWLSQHKSYAVGECGLDYYLKDLDKTKQMFYFQAQIELAKKYNLPLVLHARGAVDAVFTCLKENNYFNAMIHSYNGSIQQTKLLLDYGIKFSFGGAVCHPKAHKLHKLVKYCPTDSFMLETDAPDQNLYPNFNEINQPINLIKIFECVAHLKNLSSDDIQETTTQVCQQFFQTPK